MTVEQNTPQRSGRRDGRGQVMVIFALISVVLFVIAGLSIDAGMSYLKSDNTERAAAAAALAGVAYLPGDTVDAVNAARVEAARNGYTDNSSNSCTSISACTCTTSSPMPCVAVSEPSSCTCDNELMVTVYANVQTTFLRLLGFGSHVVQRSETAIYLPPIQLGQPGTQQGSELDTGCNGIWTSSSSPSNYCSTPSSGLGSGGNNYYFERTEGWGNPRSEGDPFTPSPAESASSCGPSGSSCDASSHPDVHAISPEEGTENWIQNPLELNYNGGYNYLVTVPAGDSVDLQVFNPAFAPSANDGGGSIYTYHESDSSFGGTGSAPDTDYSAMAYSVFSISTLSSRLADTLYSQELFYPYNASGLYYTGSSASALSFSYWTPGTGTQVTVTGQGYPDTFHQWTSALEYNPASTANDYALFKDYLRPSSGTGYLTNTSSSTEYFRLEVDTMNWDGSPTCTQTSCTYPTTGTNSYSEAHKAYAVRLVNPGSSTCGSGCSTASISAMDDMTVYTPIDGAQASQFCIPLFKLDAAYAGQTINVDIFDIGDVSGGAAYVGLELPSSTATCTSGESFASLASGMIDTGDSLTSGGTSSVASQGTWPSTSTSCGACFQTETSSGSGAAIYNGQWVQMQIQVPSSFDSSDYFELAYNVSSTATAGDTFGVQVNYDGSPDHLLP